MPDSTWTLPLRDVHLPEPVGWWPPALGWWLLAVILPLIICLNIYLYRYYHRVTVVKLARKCIAELKQDTERNENEKFIELIQLIRRVAISTASRAECAGLTGENWINYLQQKQQNLRLTEELINALIKHQYQPHKTNIPLAALMNWTEKWLKQQ